MASILRRPSLALLASVVGWGWLGYVHTVGVEHAVRVCIFRGLTGHPCPSCGTTRSVLALLQGDAAAAIDFNILGFVMLTGLILAPTLGVWGMLTNSTLLERSIDQVEKILMKRIPAALLGASLAINWIWLLTKKN